MERCRQAQPDVVLDSVNHYRRKTGQPDKYLPLWTPQDPTLFHDPGLARDIDVSFVGSMNGRHDRKAAIETLRGHGIPVLQTGGQRENRVSPEEYAGLFQRTRIALNFGRVAPGFEQAKGRIFEATLCGALLLDEENPETNVYFAPMAEYVPFTDHSGGASPFWGQPHTMPCKRWTCLPHAGHPIRTRRRSSWRTFWSVAATPTSASFS